MCHSKCVSRQSLVGPYLAGTGAPASICHMCSLMTVSRRTLPSLDHSGVQKVSTATRFLSMGCLAADRNLSKPVPVLGGETPVLMDISQGGAFWLRFRPAWQTERAVDNGYTTFGEMQR